MTIVCKSHDIVNYIINPIYESWDKITPDINPKYEQMHWPCQLYLSLMEFRNNIFNPIYESGDKITPDINPKCAQMHWPCLMVLEIA